MKQQAIWVSSFQRFTVSRQQGQLLAFLVFGALWFLHEQVPSSQPRQPLLVSTPMVLLAVIGCEVVKLYV